MRRLAVLFVALTAGCAFKIDKDGGWLPLVGAEPSLAAMPHLQSDSYSDDSYLRAPDGTIWVNEQHLDASGAPPDPVAPPQLVRRLRSLRFDSRQLDFPDDSAASGDGVLTVESLGDPGAPSDRFRIQLHSLVASTLDVVHDIQLADKTATPPTVVRGTGYVVYQDIDPQRTIHILSDDGRDDSFPGEYQFATGTGVWSFLGLEGFATTEHGLGRINGDARFLLLESANSANLTNLALAAYDRQTRELRQLLMTPPSDSGGGLIPNMFFDSQRERIWGCDGMSFTIDVTTGERRDFGVSCLSMQIEPGQPVLVEGQDGIVYALGDEGADKIGFAWPGAIRAWRGHLFIYTKPGFDNFASGAFGGWLGDVRVIEDGLFPQFSADGKKLRWLEYVDGNGVGDLYSMDLQTRAVRHLVRNVTHFAELPDGRLVAIADAAATGPWNRAIVVDEEKGETRWLGRGLQDIVVIGDAAIGVRHVETLWDSYLLSIPPR
jgi:hypothetical protein